MKTDTPHGCLKLGYRAFVDLNLRVVYNSEVACIGSGMKFLNQFILTSDNLNDRPSG